MFIKKLAHDQQSLLVATSCINTYKKAVEELVYNSLDAEATSIAIRINIDHNSIQVIDNGCGITKIDMHVIGKRHMTSNYTENNVKSIPNKYGFRGQSLANIVELSETVKITSRCKNSDESWEKCFRKGKTSYIKEVGKRPSKGTTIEIKGFLYNRNIQTKLIIPLSELQIMKIFLEQISLIHRNISFSLRDDSRNEIIFQLHKNRDVFQTLSSLYSLSKSDIQELKVEKNEYSVTAFIGKKYINIDKDWIYLNEKLVDNTSRLHGIVNDNLNKCLKDRYHRKKSKIKYIDEEIGLLKNQLPFYLLFVHCPFEDYDVIENLVEFKDWNQITKLLEKLVKFYFNDIKIKEVLPSNNDLLGKKEQSANTRQEVKKIINKILADDPKALGISQMRNGIKGKISKRKRIKNNFNSLKKKSSGKIISNHNIQSIKDINFNIKNTRKTVCGNQAQNLDRISSKYEFNKYKRNKKNINKSKYKNSNARYIQAQFKQLVTPMERKEKHKSDYLFNNTIVRKFINPTESVKKRCAILAQKAQNILNKLDERGRESNRLDKSIQCNYSLKRDRSSNIHKKMEYKTCVNKQLCQYKIDNIHIKSTGDLLKTIMNAEDNTDTAIAEERSVTHNKNEETYENKHNYPHEVLQNGPKLTKLTYESHNYEMITCSNSKEWKPNNFKFISKQSLHNFSIQDNVRRPMRYNIMKHNYDKDFNDMRQILYNNISHFKIDESLVFTSIRDVQEYPQNILESPKSSKINNQNNTLREINELKTNFSFRNYQTENLSLYVQSANEHILGETYTLPGNYKAFIKSPICPHEILPDIVTSFCQSRDENLDVEKNLNQLVNSSILEKDKEVTDEHHNSNLIYQSISQNSKHEEIPDKHCVPMDICEAVYLSDDEFENEFEFSFNKNNKQSDIMAVNTKSMEIFYDTLKNDVTRVDCDTENKEMTCSRHFGNSRNRSDSLRPDNDKDGNKTANSVTNKQLSSSTPDNGDNNQFKDRNQIMKCNSADINTFDLRDRLGFVPKGMSPIFENCNTKQVCDYNRNLDYYEDRLYHNFANDVQINADIYEAQINNINELTKDIHKIKNKTEDNDIALDFDAKSLESAIILNQVDSKFIAAIIKNNHKQNIESSNFLVLFDQHAVHERIRLENNMSEYFTDGQWKSVTVDSMTMPIPKEDLLYLHNYKDKFVQLGLHWTVASGNVISVTAIPEAILGKNPRQPDKIIAAVKNLLTEQISNIKTQKGCISFYPKSIMDLVFSEACRYAIMFGDKLSKDYCEELIQALSKCKKPFQCAHGRPVMAVVMDLENSKREFKANLTKLKCFKK